MEPVAEGQDLRPLVALLFVPGLYLCLLVSAAVALAGAALLISLIYWLASYINRIPVGIILLLALGGLYGVWVCVAAGCQALRGRTDAGFRLRDVPGAGLRMPVPEVCGGGICASAVR
jgi:uncharacterized membrane protein YqjE